MIIRMGKNKALIAVGHKILIAIYFILRDNVDYKELGANWQEAERKAKRIIYLKKQLAELEKTA